MKKAGGTAELAERAATKAKEVFKQAEAVPGLYSDSMPAAAGETYPNGGWHSFGFWAAAWLYRLTSEETYKAVRILDTEKGHKTEGQNSQRTLCNCCSHMIQLNVHLRQAAMIPAECVVYTHGQPNHSCRPKLFENLATPFEHWSVVCRRLMHCLKKHLKQNGPQTTAGVLCSWGPVRSCGS